MWKAALPALRSIRSDYLRDCNAFLLSALLHLFAFVLLALLLMSPDAGRSRLELFAQVNDGLDAPLGGGDALDESLGQFQVEPDDAATAAGPITIFDSSSPLVADTAALVSPLDALAVGGLEGRSVGDGSGTSLAGGGGSGSGGAEFFGIGGKGGSFIYVVDTSGSMNEQGKWERARAELLRSIEHLGKEQKYNIIFYNDGWIPMVVNKPVLATAKQFDRTRRWVNHVWPSGGTYPLQALLHALALEPDAIYFLSDGRFDPAVIEALRIQNPSSSGQIPIHAIAFVNTESIGLMQQIAKQSGGTFRFVK